MRVCRASIDLSSAPAYPHDSLAPAPQLGQGTGDTGLLDGGDEVDMGCRPDSLGPPLGCVYPQSTVNPLSSVIFAPNFTEDEDD